jgi:hypothetical protein
MTASDLITIYLDGEATDAERSHLFEALASSPELQREFTAALAINTAAGRDARGMVPPDHVTASLFAKAFSSPADSTIALVASSSWSFLPFLWLLSGLFMGTAAVYFTSQSLPDTTMAVAPSVTTGGSVMSASATQPDSIAAIRSISVSAGSRTGRFNTMPEFVASLQNDAHIEHVADVPATNDSHMSFSNDNNRSADVQPVGMHTVEQVRIVHLGTPSLSMEVPVAGFIDSRRWSVSVRGMSTLQLFPGRSTATDRDVAFNNLGVGVRYAVSDNITVGAEVGQETFPVFVRSASGDFAPRATMIWAAATGRYIAPSLPVFETVRPFVEAGLGASPQGPVGRGTCGLSMMLANGLSMQAGVEATALAYQLDGAWSTTQKLGFTYGLTFQW